MQAPRTATAMRLAVALTAVAALTAQLPATAAPTQLSYVKTPGAPYYKTAVSGDGRFIAYLSSNGGPNYGSSVIQVRLFDTRRSTTELISASASGQPGNSSSLSVAISRDGRYVAYASAASNLMPGGTGNPNVFLYDRTRKVTTIVGRGTPGTMPFSMLPLMGSVGFSDDGRYILFVSDIDLGFQGCRFPSLCAYRYDARNGTLELVSRGTDGDAVAVNDPSGGWGDLASLSPDGNQVAFVTSRALLSSDGDADADIYLRDITTGKLTLVSSGLGELPGSRMVYHHPRFDRVGRAVTFDGYDPQLVVTYQFPHAFIRELTAPAAQQLEGGVAAGFTASWLPVALDRTHVYFFASTIADVNGAAALWKSNLSSGGPPERVTGNVHCPTVQNSADGIRRSIVGAQRENFCGIDSLAVAASRPVVAFSSGAALTPDDTDDRVSLYWMSG